MYKAKGERWLEESDDGQEYLKNYFHEFIKTKIGEAWYKVKGQQWLISSDGQEYMWNHSYKFIETEIGKQWLNSKDGRNYIKSAIKRWAPKAE